MIKTPAEIQADLGARVKARRVAMRLTQQDAAARAGVAHRTWRRLEGDGQASIADLVKAAVALRCEEGVDQIFPLPPATSLDQLLKQQAELPAPQRVRKGKAQ